MTEDTYYKEYWQTIKDSELQIEDLIIHFPTFIRHYEMTKFIAHYELFKKIIDMPGHIVELGVFQGASFFTWVKLLDAFCPGDITRNVYGFESFQGLQEFSDEDGSPSTTDADRREGAFSSNPKTLRTMLKLNTKYSLRTGVSRGFIVEGDIQSTLPRFLEEVSGLRISLLYLDMDLYLPTKLALEHLYPLVISGGIVAVDQYAQIPWEGESKAVEEYFKNTFGKVPAMKKLSFSVSPHAYFIKEGEFA